MGLSESTVFDERKFLNEWTISDQLYNHHPVWSSKLNPNIQLEECPIFAHSQDDILLFKTLFQLRRNSPELVTAHYLKQIQKGGLCTAGAEGKLYLEKIMLRLSEIQHVPYPDSLHLMFTALAGYRKLVREVGVFKVQESQIGFTQNGEAKVWLDGDFSAVKPSMMEHSEQSMVHAIVQLVQDIVDHETTPREIPSLIKYIFEQKENPGIVGFDQALIRVRDYANMYNDGQIPKYMECIRQVGVGKILKSLETNAKIHQQISRKEVPINSNMWKSDVYQDRVENGNYGDRITQKNVSHNQFSKTLTFNQPQTSLTKALSTGQLNIQLPQTSNSKPIPQYIRKLSPRSSTSPLTLPSPNPRPSILTQTPNIKFNNKGVQASQKGGERPRFSHQVLAARNEVRQGNMFPVKTNAIVLDQQVPERVSHSLGPQIMSPKFTITNKAIQANQSQQNSTKFQFGQYPTQPQVIILPNSQQQVHWQPISQPIIANPTINQLLPHLSQKISQQYTKNNPQQVVLQQNKTNGEKNKRVENVKDENELVAAHEPIEKLEELNDSVEEVRVEQVSKDGERELQLSQINGREQGEPEDNSQTQQSQSYSNNQQPLISNNGLATAQKQSVLPNNHHQEQQIQQQNPKFQSSITPVIHQTFIPHYQPFPIHFSHQQSLNQPFIHQSNQLIQHLVPIQTVNGPIANRTSQKILINGHPGQVVNQQQFVQKKQPVLVQGDSRMLQQYQPIILGNGGRGSHIIQQVIGQPVMMLPNKVSTQQISQINHPISNHAIHNLPINNRVIGQQIYQQKQLQVQKKPVYQQKLLKAVQTPIKTIIGETIQGQVKSNQLGQIQEKINRQVGQCQEGDENQFQDQQKRYEQQQEQEQEQKQRSDIQTTNLQAQHHLQSLNKSQQPQKMIQQEQLICDQQLQLQSQEQQPNHSNNQQQQHRHYQYYQEQQQQDHYSLQQHQEKQLQQYENKYLTQYHQLQPTSQEWINSDEYAQYYEENDQQHEEYFDKHDEQYASHDDDIDYDNFNDQPYDEQQPHQDIVTAGQNIDDYADVFNSQQQQQQQLQPQSPQFASHNHHLSTEIQRHPQQIHIHQTQPLSSHTLPFTQSPQRQSKISLQSNIINLEITQSIEQTKTILSSNPIYNRKDSQPQHQPLSIHTLERVNDLGNSPIIDFYKKDSNYGGIVQHPNGHQQVNSTEESHQQNMYNNHSNSDYNKQSLYDYYNYSHHQNNFSSSINSQSYKQQLYDTEPLSVSEITHQYQEFSEVIPQKLLYRPLSKRKQQEKYSFDQYFDRTLRDDYNGGNAQKESDSKINSYETYQQYGNHYGEFGRDNKLEKGFQRDVDNVAFSFGANYDNNKYSSSGYMHVDSTPTVTSSKSRINNTQGMDLSDGKSPSFLLQQIRKITSNKSTPSSSLSSMLYNPTEKQSSSSAQTSLNPKDIYNTFSSYSSFSNKSTNNKYSLDSNYVNEISGSRTKFFNQVNSSSYSKNAYEEYDFQSKKPGNGADNYNYGQNSGLQEALHSNQLAKDFTHNYTSDYSNTYNINYTNQKFKGDFIDKNLNSYNNSFSHSYQLNAQLVNDDQEYRVDFDPQILADIQKLSQ